jgi:carbon-monoxide dehydrogenase medium subunit
VKPPPFAYHAPTELAEAVALLADEGEDAKVLAGGQSLVPAMNFRLARPSALVDINRVRGLDTLSYDVSGLTIGATVRHARLERDHATGPLAALLGSVAGWVGHLPIRVRGTVLGSLAHADPAAEWPLVTKVLGGELVATSVRGTRRIAADDFFGGFFTTALQPDEILTELRLPRLFPETSWGFREFSRRAGDFALVAALVVLDARDHTVARARVGFAGVASTPVRAVGVERFLEGSAIDELDLAEVHETVADELEPAGDAHASAEYRRQLAAGLASGALADALSAEPP